MCQAIFDCSHATHNVCTGSAVVDSIVLITSCCAVCVVPSAVEVVLNVTVVSSLMVSVEVGRTEVRITIFREIVVLRIV